eukprot:111758-Chlamydomonas_euryale.AAC.14
MASNRGSYPPTSAASPVSFSDSAAAYSSGLERSTASTPVWVSIQTCAKDTGAGAAVSSVPLGLSSPVARPLTGSMPASPRPTASALLPLASKSESAAVDVDSSASSEQRVLTACGAASMGVVCDDGKSVGTSAPPCKRFCLDTAASAASLASVPRVELYSSSILSTSSTSRQITSCSHSAASAVFSSLLVASASRVASQLRNPIVVGSCRCRTNCSKAEPSAAHKRVITAKSTS